MELSNRTRNRPFDGVIIIEISAVALALLWILVTIVRHVVLVLVLVLGFARVVAQQNTK